MTNKEKSRSERKGLVLDHFDLTDTGYNIHFVRPRPSPRRPPSVRLYFFCRLSFSGPVIGERPEDEVRGDVSWVGRPYLYPVHPLLNLGGCERGSITLELVSSTGLHSVSEHPRDL